MCLRVITRASFFIVDCEVRGMSSVLVEQVLCRCCLFVVVCYAELAGKGAELFSGCIILGTIMGLSAPVADRPCFEFSSSSERIIVV